MNRDIEELRAIAITRGQTLDKLEYEMLNDAMKEIERLNNIINELENYFEEKDNDGYEKLYVEDILYKLKELKESDNNE